MSARCSSSEARGRARSNSIRALEPPPNRAFRGSSEQPRAFAFVGERGGALVYQQAATNPLRRRADMAASSRLLHHRRVEADDRRRGARRARSASAPARRSPVRDAPGVWKRRPLVDGGSYERVTQLEHRAAQGVSRAASAASSASPPPTSSRAAAPSTVELARVVAANQQQRLRLLQELRTARQEGALEPVAHGQRREERLATRELRLAQRRRQLEQGERGARRSPRPAARESRARAQCPRDDRAAQHAHRHRAREP